MEFSKKEQLNFWLSRAKETFEDTKIAFDLHRLNMAYNRSYYTMFYAVTVLALSQNFLTTKHSELKGWFNKNFIKTGIFEIK